MFYVQIHCLQVCMTTAASVEPSHSSLDCYQQWFHRLFCNSTVILAEKKSKISYNMGGKALLEKILRGFLVIIFSLYIVWASVSLHKSSSVISLWINTLCPAMSCCCLQPGVNLWKECCNYKLLFLGQFFWGNLNKKIILELNCSPERSMSYPFKTELFCSIFLHIFVKG